jgi:purine-cytosine permease-like protein
VADKTGAWRAKIMNAVVVVLVVAVGARVAAELLAPLVPALAVLVTFGVVFTVALGGRFRR